jgi:membrane protein YqaA with SNARE-associated domain
MTARDPHPELLHAFRTLALTVLTVAAVVGAVAGAMTVYSLGALIQEARTERIQAGILRQRFIDTQTVEANTLEDFARTMTVLTRTICEHVTRVDRVHKPCP